MADDFRLPFTARDMESIIAELEELVQNTEPDLWSDFFESNLGQLIIRFNALVGDMISMGIDVTGGEVFLSTMQLYESALRFCRSVGYVPRSASSAEADMYSTVLPQAITLNGGTIPVGSYITSQTGLKYELLEEATIEVGATQASMTLVEGTSYSEEFEHSAQPKQEVTTANGVVAEGSWDVYVGPVSPANLWTQVDSLALETEPTETYQVAFDGDGHLTVIFGDGASGKIPDDDITIEYRTTAGSEGNVPIYAISGSVKVNVGGGGGTVSVTFENSQSKADGGSDRESLDELRTNVPAYLRSQDQILSLLDYEAQTPRVSGVSLVFADIVAASYSRNVVKVHAWGTTDTTFTSESYDLTVQSDEDYTEYSQIAYSLLDDIQNFLKPRTPLNVHAAIVRPTMAYADVYLSTVYYESGYVKADLHSAITQAVIGVFENAGGFLVEINELYNAIRDVAGVSRFYIDRVVFTRLLNIAATGSIELSGQPQDGDTITIGDGIITKTFEFDSNFHVTTGNADVTIGADAAETLDNLRLRINSYLEIYAETDETAVDPTILLTNNNPGEDGNQTITKSEAGAVITVAGMSGGSDDPTEQSVDYRRDQNVPLEDDQWPPGTYDESSPATGTVVFDGGANPTDTETVTIGDGATTAVFEFDDNASVTPGNIAVTIGGTAAVTLANLLTAIEANLDIDAETDTGATDPTLNLTNNTAGSVGNVTSSTTGANITVTGMDGGGTGVGYWRDGGIEPYEPIQDIAIISALRHSDRYYDATYAYNNEIYYDATDYDESNVQAINLRRLILDLSPEV